jgi:hypothetical protein
MAPLIEDCVRFDDEHMRLLTAQVVLTELNALITSVDGVIRKLPDLPN